MPWFRSIKKAQELIKWEIEKCEKWPQEGRFYLVLCVPADKLTLDKLAAKSPNAALEPPPPSILLIKSDPKEDFRGSYKTIATSGSRATLAQDPLEITGRFTSDKAKKTWTFVYDDESKVQGKKAEDDVVASTYLGLALWQFMPKDTAKVYFHGPKAPAKLEQAEIDAPPLSDDEVEFTHWDLRFLLRWVAEHDQKQQRPPEVEQIEKDGGVHRWPFKSIRLPAIEIAPSAKGHIAIALQNDPTLHQMFYDAGWDAAKPHAKELKKKLDDIDAKLGDGRLTAEAAEPLVRKALEEFQKTLLSKVAEDVNKIWVEYAGSNQQYRRYKIRCGFRLVTGITGIAIGVTSTILGGWTGVGTVLGCLSVLKSTISLAQDCYLMALSVDSLGQQLTDSMTEAQERLKTESRHWTGTKEVGAEVLKRLTGYQKDCMSRFKSRHGQYKEKINACLAKSKEASQGLNKALDASATAQKELEAKILASWKQACATLSEAEIQSSLKPDQKLNPGSPETEKTIAAMVEALKKIKTPEGQEAYVSWKILALLQKQLSKGQKALDSSLKQISKQMERYTRNKPKAEEMEKWLKELDAAKQIPLWADVVCKYVVPVADFAFAGSVDSVKSTALSLGCEITLTGAGAAIQYTMDKVGARDDAKDWADLATSSASTLASMSVATRDLIKAAQDFKLKH